MHRGAALVRQVLRTWVESSSNKVRRLGTGEPSSRVRCCALRSAASDQRAGDRVAFLVDKEQFAPGLEQVRLDVEGEHAQEDVGTRPVLEPVMDEADLQIAPFKRAKRALYLSQPLVVASHLSGIHDVGRHCGADHVQAV